MIAFTTRNRPHVLEYSLKKTRQVYDGQIIVVDDNSDTREPNQFACNKYDAAHLYNETRLGIPRSKERGFRSLLDCSHQYWFDDDGYLFTSPVGTYAPNELGIYDFSSNVYEWCWDWFDDEY